MAYGTTHTYSCAIRLDLCSVPDVKLQAIQGKNARQPRGRIANRCNCACAAGTRAPPHTHRPKGAARNASSGSMACRVARITPKKQKALLSSVSQHDTGNRSQHKAAKCFHCAELSTVAVPQPPSSHPQAPPKRTEHTLVLRARDTRTQHTQQPLPHTAGSSAGGQTDNWHSAALRARCSAMRVHDWFLWRVESVTAPVHINSSNFPTETSRRAYTPNASWHWQTLILLWSSALAGKVVQGWRST